MGVLGSFKLKIMNPDRMVFEGEVGSVFIQSDTGEFEILAYHYPILCLLKQGQLIIDWKFAIPVKRGLARFFRNDCVIVAELLQEE